MDESICQQGLVLFSLAAAQTFREPSWPVWTYFANAIVLDFFFGMIVGRQVLKGRLIQPSVAAALIVAGLVFLFVPAAFENVAPKLTFLAGIASFFVVYGAVSIEPYLPPIHPLFLYMGAASYSLYLTHPMASQIAPAVFARFGLQLPYTSVVLGVVFAVVGGAFAYRFVERPISLFLERYSLNARPGSSGPRQDDTRRPR